VEFVAQNQMLPSHCNPLFFELCNSNNCSKFFRSDLQSVVTFVASGVATLDPFSGLGGLHRVQLRPCWVGEFFFFKWL